MPFTKVAADRVMPTANKVESSNEVYPNNIRGSSRFREKLESSLLGIVCLLMGPGLTERERSRGWGLFRANLGEYLNLIHFERRDLQ
ncbi:hypothetical protein ACFL02_00350 [Planctomycetota bacterium]